jgi:hypothetical protein
MTKYELDKILGIFSQKTSVHPVRDWKIGASGSEASLIPFFGSMYNIKLSRSAFFDEKSIPFHQRFPCSS